MKQFIIKLKEAIHRGILRIFPLPLKPIIYLLILSALLLVGCAAPKQVTQLVHDVRVDTVYMTNQQYDSIYIYKDRMTDRSRDTVYLKDISVEYRYKLLRDTVRIVQRDSIPYQITVIETKEITRPLTFFDRLCRICFYFLSGVISVLLVRFVIKLRTKLRP